MLSLLSLLAQLLFRVLKVYLIVVCQVCCYLQLWNMFRLGTIKVFKHYCSCLDSFMAVKGFTALVGVGASLSCRTVSTCRLLWAS